MLSLDTWGGSQPRHCQRPQWPRLAESRALECGLGWTSECLRAPVTILGGQWCPEVSVRWHLWEGSGPSHSTWQLCAVNCPQIPSLSLGWSWEKDLGAKTFRCHLGRKAPSTWNLPVCGSGLLLKRTLERCLGGCFKGRVFVVDLFACFKIKTHC